jgi:autotransporter-associated beta strand protein
LLKTNSGTLTLALDNDYTGSTVVASGTLQIGDGAVSAGSLARAHSRTIARVMLNRPDDITFGAAIHGTGGGQVPLTRSLGARAF